MGEEQKHHTGTVQITDGSVTKDGDDISGNFTIDMTTIENSDLDGEQKAGLEMHLKGQREDDKGSFFNVDEYATVEVALNSIKDGMADITINVLGTDIEETVPVETKMTIMKKTMYAAFVFAALGLTACKGESSEGEGEMTDAKETVKEEKEMPTTFNVVAEEKKK